MWNLVKLKSSSNIFEKKLSIIEYALVLTVSGALCTESDARNQVAFGVAMYAGSTVISLTGIWGVNVILNKEEIGGAGQPKHSKHKLSYVTG